jgi:hypothetical protein
LKLPSPTDKTTNHIGTAIETAFTHRKDNKKNYHIRTETTTSVQPPPTTTTATKYNKNNDYLAIGTLPSELPKKQQLQHHHHRHNRHRIF